MDTALYQSKPQPKDFAAAAREAVDMGYNAVKFDLDQANDPKNTTNITGLQALLKLKECIIKWLQLEGSWPKYRYMC